MHGSYIGFVLGFIVSYVTLAVLSIEMKFSYLKPSAYFVIFAPLLIGFLLGWSLHSLIRVTRK